MMKCELDLEKERLARSADCCDFGFSSSFLLSKVGLKIGGLIDENSVF